MLILLPGHQFNLVWLVWGQCHTKAKVIPRSNCKCLTFYWQAGGGPSTKRLSSCLLNFPFTDKVTNLWTSSMNEWNVKPFSRSVPVMIDSSWLFAYTSALRMPVLGSRHTSTSGTGSVCLRRLRSVWKSLSCGVSILKTLSLKIDGKITKQFERFFQAGFWLIGLLCRWAEGAATFDPLWSTTGFIAS